MKVLADEFQGSYRFAYINILEDELLKEAFDVMTVPQNFFIKDGQVYEMEAMTLGYLPIRKFMTHGYKNSTQVYR